LALAGDGLEEAVAALRTFALLSRETFKDERDPEITTETVRLHRLVREVAAALLAGDAREDGRRTLIAALAAVYPDDAFLSPTLWPRCAPLTPHVLALCGTEAGAAAASQENAELLAKAGRYFHGRAAYAAARPLFERALAIREEAPGPEHPDTAKGLNNFASMLLTEGDLAGALPLHERALAIREEVLGPEHPDTADSLNNLGYLLREQGNFAGAKPLFERALAIYEKVLGPEHPKMAFSLSNLARVLRDSGHADEAEPLFRRAIDIGQNVLGRDHTTTQRFSSEYARLLLGTGRAAAALEIAQPALTAHEAASGPQAKADAGAEFPARQLSAISRHNLAVKGCNGRKRPNFRSN
jgi:tetratricopeptide (TPR) repeat protein